MGDRGLYRRVAIKPDALDPSALVAEVARPDSGATVLFLGTARDHSPGKEGVTHLDYEIYHEFVEAKLGEVLDAAFEQWSVLSAVVEHRVGRVEIGEASVAVAVSSAHRNDAFSAARFVIDSLKESAPIWKRENWPGGSVWVEGA